MSGLVRRLIISATVDGLVLHTHGAGEQQKSVALEYGSARLRHRATNTPQHGVHGLRLEAFGIIGLVEIADSYYLIAITRRKEVAKIFGKPIYLVEDVAVLPLSSQHDAEDALKSATKTDGLDSDDSDNSDSEAESQSTRHEASATLSTTPGDDVPKSQGKNASSTSIAEIVATRNVSFGRFASQWFSRQKPTDSGTSVNTPKNEPLTPKPAEKGDAIVEDVEQAVKAKEAGSDSPNPSNITYAATRSLLPRILRTIKMVFTSQSYFYSYDFDLTKRIQGIHNADQKLNVPQMESVFFWNRSIGRKFLESEHQPFLTPILQGFVGQRAFTLSKPPESDASKAKVEEVVKNVSELAGTASSDDHKQSFLLTIISRRSTKRSGLRYLRRGIDDDGNVANFAETEQILSAADWGPSLPIRSFMQIRGSIPVYFSQSPYAFKPAVVFHNSPQVNDRVYNKHFQMLKNHYGNIQIAVLVDRHGNEKPIGEAYEKLYETSEEHHQAEGVAFKWFDFHVECRGMKFENISKLVEEFDGFLKSSGETVLHKGVVIAKQGGVIRTNCMDCLDRTNVAQSAFAQHQLQSALQAEGFPIDFVKDPSTNWFNTLWADNGDAISRLYASTAALKGDYTRTRKRNWRGAMNDFGLTISRYYSNMVNDYFSQTVLDVLLGNVSWKVFEDFESTMMSTDPGVSVGSAREAAIETCSKIVIQDPDKEDIIHAWTMMVPNQENTLRTLPLEEAVVLLTDAAIYCCKMDWSTEKIARYEKVDLRSIRSIKTGTYITSTFTARQMDDEVNQGLVIYYTPGKGDLIRVNTRSLANYQVPDPNERHGVDGGTGLLSWVASSVTKQPTVQERMMALKVVTSGDDDVLQTSKTGGPKQIAETVADEIRRAITGSTDHGEQRGHGMLEKGDIISIAEAKKRTGYLEQVGHSIRKLVWA